MFLQLLSMQYKLHVSMKRQYSKLHHLLLDYQILTSSPLIQVLVFFLFGSKQVKQANK